MDWFQRLWIMNRLKERTSLDGAVLIALGVVCLLFSPFVKFAAYGAIAYGAWTLLKGE
jgi:hypothetical protein|tara:strand:- start:215 stop:388 length:174 start_codon:yes stop_codon:yes gene_type:complete